MKINSSSALLQHGKTHCTYLRLSYNALAVPSYSGSPPLQMLKKNNTRSSSCSQRASAPGPVASYIQEESFLLQVSDNLSLLPVAPCLFSRVHSPVLKSGQAFTSMLSISRSSPCVVMAGHRALQKAPAVGTASPCRSLCMTWVEVITHWEQLWKKHVSLGDAWYPALMCIWKGFSFPHSVKENTLFTMA